MSFLRINTCQNDFMLNVTLWKSYIYIFLFCCFVILKNFYLKKSSIYRGKTQCFELASQSASLHLFINLCRSGSAIFIPLGCIVFVIVSSSATVVSSPVSKWLGKPLSVCGSASSHHSSCQSLCRPCVIRHVMHHVVLRITRLSLHPSSCSSLTWLWTVCCRRHHPSLWHQIWTGLCCWLEQ